MMMSILNILQILQVLIDGPQAGVERQEYKIKSLHLTPLKVTFAFSARTKVVRKAWEDEKISEKWAESLGLKFYRKTSYVFT